MTARTAVIAGVLGAFAILGCKSSASTTPTASCVDLATCCATGSSAIAGACSAVLERNDEAQCSLLLTSYQTSGACSPGLLLLDGGLPQLDATVPHDGSTVRFIDTGVDAPTFVGPSCPGPTTTPSADCQKCTANCEVSNGYSEACASYYDCYCPCAAGDTGCQQACAPLEGDCQDVAEAVTSCVQSDCSSLCATRTGTDAGGHDSGACAEIVACCQAAESEQMMDGGLCAMFSTMSESACAADLADGGIAHECETLMGSEPR